MSANATNRGRPKTAGTGQLVGVRILPDRLEALDTWRGEQDDQPSRPEAIRRIITEWLYERGYLRDDLSEAVAAAVRENTRPRGYWHWKDRPIGEAGAARTVLSSAGLDIESLVSRGEGNDPPDCEAIINGKRCAVEVTELLDEKTLNKSLKGNERHFIWDQDAVLRELHARIAQKDKQAAKAKGGPYDRYLLVIVTDELFLGRDPVERFLAGASFAASRITDAYLGLSYNPAIRSCPVFQLRIEPGQQPSL